MFAVSVCNRLAVCVCLKRYSVCVAVSICLVNGITVLVGNSNTLADDNYHSALAVITRGLYSLESLCLVEGSDHNALKRGRIHSYPQRQQWKSIEKH